MTGFETLRMPTSLPASFADGFANLASISGALPISHFSIARIGLDATPTDPLPPLIAIDGSPRPARAPGLADGTTASSEGYEAAWNELQDMFDLPPSAVEGFQLNPMDIGRAKDAGWLTNHNSIREILASGEASHKACMFFAEAFGTNAGEINMQILKKNVSATRFLEIIQSRDEHGRYKCSMSKDLQSADRKGIFEVAKNRFLEGAFLARAGGGVPLARAEEMFIQSAMGFALAERFSAAAMTRELAREMQIREGRPMHETRHNEAEMWLAELKREGDDEFDAIYLRALNAAQVDHPGSGLLEGIFDASTEHYLGIGDRKEAARAFVRTAWARLMKLDAPGASPDLSSDDWFRTSIDLLTARTFFGHEDQNLVASMAEALASLASDLVEKTKDGPLVSSSRPPRPYDEPTANLRPSMKLTLAADIAAARNGEGALSFAKPGDPEDKRDDEVGGRPEDFDGQTTE